MIENVDNLVILDIPRAMLRRPRFYVRRIPIGGPEAKGGYLLIVFDEDLRDRVLMIDNRPFTLPMKGKRITEDKLRELLRNALGATLIGEHAVRIAVQEGLVLKDSILYLRDDSGREVPYAIYIRIRIANGIRCKNRYLFRSLLKAFLYTLSSIELISEKARGATRRYPRLFTIPEGSPSRNLLIASLADTFSLVSSLKATSTTSKTIVLRREG